MSEEDIERYIWIPHHTWAGDELYGMCIDLRGFYSKVTRSSQLTDTLNKASLKADHRTDRRARCEVQIAV